MKQTIKLLALSSIAGMFLTGCSFSNPLGVGHEKSSCEVSSGFGVCGSPKHIYVHKDKIKKIQADYMKSGYEDDLFFAISPKGDVLVKTERGDANWENYDMSEIRKDIESRLRAKHMGAPVALTPNVDIGSIGLSQDIPVTIENDLSVRYSKQKFLLETQEVGGMIRDTGKIQKIWMAPVVDKKDNLISARTAFVVLKEPKWIIGESTPKTTSKNVIPTPLSEEILKKQESYSEHNENVVSHFNNNNRGGLEEEIQHNPTKISKEINQDLIEINKFLKR